MFGSRNIVDNDRDDESEKIQNISGDEQPDAAPYELLRTIMPRKDHSNAHGKHEYRRANRSGQEFQYDPEKTGRQWGLEIDIA